METLTESGIGRLSAALRLYGGKLCQDPRDKIYGLLAISSLIFRDQIVVDYRYTIGQVYQMAATAFILEEGDLGSTFWGPRFYTSELASEDKEKRTLPSWIPDFSSANIPVEKRKNLYSTDGASLSAVLTSVLVTSLSIKPQHIG